MFLLASLALLWAGVSAAGSPPPCKRIEEYKGPLNLTATEGVWRLVASTTREKRYLDKDERLHYAWFNFTFHDDRATIKHVTGMDGIIKSEVRELLIYKKNGITSFTDEGKHFVLTVYQMSEDSILVTERIRYYSDGDVPIQLFSRTAHLPDAQLEEFKRLKDCMGYTHISVRQDAIDYASTCEQNSLRSTYPLNLTLIEGQWRLVATATRRGKVNEPLGHNHTRWIVFSVHGDTVTYQESSSKDGQTDTFHLGPEDIWVSETQIQIKKGWDIFTLWFYKTCEGCLLIGTIPMPEDSSESVLHFYTRGGNVTASDLETFKLQAQCESLTNVSVAPGALEKGNVEAAMASTGKPEEAPLADSPPGIYTERTGDEISPQERSET